MYSGINSSIVLAIAPHLLRPLCVLLFAAHPHLLSFRAEQADSSCAFIREIVGLRSREILLLRVLCRLCVKKTCAHQFITIPLTLVFSHFLREAREPGASGLCFNVIGLVPRPLWLASIPPLLS